MVRDYIMRNLPKRLHGPARMAYHSLLSLKRNLQLAVRFLVTSLDRIFNKVLPRELLVRKEAVKYEYYWRRQWSLSSERVGERFAVDKLCRLLDFKTVLDVGCGPGQSVHWLLEHGYDTKGCDISRYVVDNPVPELHDKNVLHCAPASDLPFADNSFDVVFCTDVMEHIPEENIDTSIREMARVVRKYLFLTICLYPSSLRNLVEYHATIRPRDWWEARFAAAGLRQLRDLEGKIQGSEHISPGGRVVPVEYFIYAKL